MKLLGPLFLEQTPEAFHAYAKDVHKYQNIKKPETIKSKTRKKKTKNGKHDNNARSESSSDNSGKTQEDAQNIENG